MLLDREQAGVERCTKNFDVGHGTSPETAKWEDQELGDNLIGWTVEGSAFSILADIHLPQIL